MTLTDEEALDCRPRLVRAIQAHYPGVDAEDLVHDAFVRALSTSTTFRGDAAKQTYLFAIARREALRFIHRREKLWKAVSSMMPSFPSRGPLDSIAAMRAIATLPIADRRVLHRWAIGEKHESRAAIKRFCLLMRRLRARV